MKKLIFLFTLFLFAAEAFASASIIICGQQPGEIYFVGVHPEHYGGVALYYSSNFGEDIELRDLTVGGYGNLVADAADNSLYQFYSRYPYWDFLFSNNGGRYWVIRNTMRSRIHTSGTIPGEVYIGLDSNLDILERSADHGESFVQCSCSGFPDSSYIYSATLGVDSGEVYIWGYGAHLYYSADYADSFTFKGEYYPSWGVDPWSKIYKGAEPGEIYVFSRDWERIWRIFNFGDSAEVVRDFSLGMQWYCNVAVSGRPGEVYFYGMCYDYIAGGLMRIYHSTDYGRYWTMYEHTGPSSGVERPDYKTPTQLSLNAYPNPSNLLLNIVYGFTEPGLVELELINILGKRIIVYNQGKLTSGSHYCQLQTKSEPLL